MRNRLLSKTIAISLTLALVLATGVPSFAAAIKKPSIHARGAIAYCADTGKVLYSKRANTKYDPLSTTKLLTAYIVMKRGIDLNKTVTISSETASTPWMSWYHLRKGEKIKVKYLLYFALLPSENDAAAALGQAVAGNKKAFAKIMNKEAKALGCTNSHFTNAHGCIYKTHKSTAKDMMLIAKAAFRYSLIRKICGTRSYTIPKTNKYQKRTIYMTNNFIYYFNKTSYSKYNVKGGKTGTWDYGNAALVEMSRQYGKTIYTVVFKDSTKYRYTDTKKLIIYSKKVLAAQAKEDQDKEDATTGDTTGGTTGGTTTGDTTTGDTTGETTATGN